MGLDRLSSLSFAARAALAEALVFLLVILINPFGIVEWSEDRSRDIWQRLHAPHYAAAGSKAPGAERGRDQVTVVYLDDNSLERLALSRPLSTFALADIIEDLALVGGQGGAPRAMFIDFVLTDSAPQGSTGAQLVAQIPLQRDACAQRLDGGKGLSPFQCLLVKVAELTRYESWRDRPHCRESSLATLACIREAGGLPLIFADPRPGAESLSPVSRAPTGSAALDALGEVAMTAPVAFHERHYPVAAPANGKDRANRPFRLYPASALYAAWCAEPKDRCRPNPMAKSVEKGLAWPADYDGTIDVVWGVGGRSELLGALSDHVAGTQEQSCTPGTTDTWDTGLRALRLFASGVNFDEEKPCIYQEAIPYEIFQSGLSQEQAVKALGGKLVLLGGQFRDSNDVVPAAPFDGLPGVYYHAMALDNLIEGGTDYPRAQEPIFEALDVTWVDLLNLAAILAVAFLLALATAELDRIEESRRKSGTAFAADLFLRIVVAAVFASIIVGTMIIMVGPVGVIPASFNVVAVTLVCMYGIIRLGWAALLPVRVLLLRRFAFIQVLSALLAPQREKPQRRKGRPRRRKGNAHEASDPSDRAARRGAAGSGPRAEQGQGGQPAPGDAAPA